MATRDDEPEKFPLSKKGLSLDSKSAALFSILLLGLPALGVARVLEIGDPDRIRVAALVLAGLIAAAAARHVARPRQLAAALDEDALSVGARRIPLRGARLALGEYRYPRVGALGVILHVIPDTERPVRIACVEADPDSFALDAEPVDRFHYSMDARAFASLLAALRKRGRLPEARANRRAIVTDGSRCDG